MEVQLVLWNRLKLDYSAVLMFQTNKLLFINLQLLERTACQITEVFLLRPIYFISK